MTLRKIKSIHRLVMALPKRPNQLRFANAYIDQALMNFSYETMTKKSQDKAIILIGEMIRHFNSIRGR